MTVEFSSYGVALLIVQGLVIMALLRGLRSVIERAELRTGTRERIERILPVGEAIIALVYLLSAVPQIFKEDPEWSPIAVSIVLFGVGYVSWFAIHDYVGGVFLRAGRIMRVGDHVTASGHMGKVVRLGFRTLTLRTKEEQDVVVPYSAVARTPVVRRVTTHSIVRHEFHLPRPENLPAHAIQSLRCATAVLHWCVVSEPVQIELGEHTLSIVAHLISEEYAAEVELHAMTTLNALCTVNK